MNKKEIPVGSVARLAVIAIGIAAAVFTAWSCVDSQKIFAAIGLIASFIVLAPFLQLDKYDLCSPWSLVILAIGLLSTPQAVCMTFNWPEAERIERMLILGREPEFFLYPSAIYLLGLGCMTAGYFWFSGETSFRFASRRQLNSRNTVIVLTATLLLSAVSTVAFVGATGGVSSGRISDKRTNLETLDVKDSETRQYGHLRQTSKLASVVFVILYCLFLAEQRKMSTLKVTILLLAFLTAIALPFYASSRQQVCWVILNGLGVNYYFGNRKTFVTTCCAVAAVGLTMFLLMSQLRAKDTDSAIDSASISQSFESLILNRNGPGISKTALIINSIPEKLDHKYGATFTNWLLAPVPRALYPGKPMIGAGPEVGTKIYGTKYSGVPPGYIAELYWNFHIPGVIFGMLFLGWLLKFVYKLCWSLQIPPAVIVPIYLFAVMPIAFGVLCNSAGYGTMMRLVDFVAVSTVLFFCTTRAPQMMQLPQQRAVA